MHTAGYFKEYYTIDLSSLESLTIGLYACQLTVPLTVTVWYNRLSGPLVPPGAIDAGQCSSPTEPLPAAGSDSVGPPDCTVGCRTEAAVVLVANEVNQPGCLRRASPARRLSTSYQT
jgi:hypothetical protein